MQAQSTCWERPKCSSTQNTSAGCRCISCVRGPLIEAAAEIFTQGAQGAATTSTHLSANGATAHVWLCQEAGREAAPTLGYPPRPCSLSVSRMGPCRSNRRHAATSASALTCSRCSTVTHCGPPAPPAGAARCCCSSLWCTAAPAKAQSTHCSHCPGQCKCSERHLHLLGADCHHQERGMQAGRGGREWEVTCIASTLPPNLDWRCHQRHCCAAGSSVGQGKLCGGAQAGAH